MNVRDDTPAYAHSPHFNLVAEHKTEPAPTLDILKPAVHGETGASAKYALYAETAEATGYDQVARLFKAASYAEQVHIRLESALVVERDPDYVKPVAPECERLAVDLSLIDAAKGEIFETSDMYPTFIEQAVDEGDERAVKVFSRAKLAESVHAEKYLEAYNNIDAADDDAYYVCPGCGYIHKGEDFETCPICGAPKSSFKKF